MSINLSLMAQYVFMMAAWLLFYVYVGYPALLAILTFFWRRPKAESGYYPRLSVIIAAYNEEASIGRKIEQTLALEYPADKLEVVVVSDGSTDRTDALVKACTDPRVHFSRIEDRRGKTHAQNVAVKQCTGEVVVFSDATAVYHRKALEYLACNYHDSHVGAVSGRYHYFDPEGQSPTGLGSVAFWNYENLIKKLQSQISTLTGCSGCIYSIRRSVYEPLPDSACSDLVEPLHVVLKGFRVVFEDRALAYEETTKSSKEEFRMRVRVAANGISGMLLLPELLKFWRHGWVAFQLISHKILRWLVPIYLILLFASSAALLDRAPFRYLFLFQALFYLFGLISMLVPLHRHWRPLGFPLYFCTLHLAALVSMIELFRGHRYIIWETARR